MISVYADIVKYDIFERWEALTSATTGRKLWPVRLMTLGSANTRRVVSMQTRINEAIQTHYTRADLGDIILAALEKAGRT